jgi:hypothetical protein
VEVAARALGEALQCGAVDGDLQDPAVRELDDSVLGAVRDRRDRDAVGGDLRGGRLHGAARGVGAVGQQHDMRGRRLGLGLLVEGPDGIPRSHHGVADRRGLTRGELFDGPAQHHAVGGRRDRDGGGTAERHQSDVEPLRQPVDEGDGGALGRVHAGGLDVGGLHGAGDIEGDHDGGPLARYLHIRGGAREADDQQPECGAEGGGGDVPPPSGPAGRDLVEQIEVGEPDGVPAPAPLHQQIRADQSGERHQEQQPAG